MPAYIQSIGTAVPTYQIPQKKIAEFMQKALELNEQETHELNVLYRASGIDYRHSVIEDFQDPDKPGKIFRANQKNPDLSVRMQIYEEEAIKLATMAIKNGFSSEELEGVTHLITVSCTGMYAPGLDIDILRAFGMSTHIQRTAINFMGCYGVFNGLKLANSICHAHPDAKILIVSVELCTIHFQNRKDIDSLLSQALFSDGAAATMVTGTSSKPGLELINFHCDLDYSGYADMSWKIGAEAFDMILTSEVPGIIKKGIHKLAHDLLEHLPILPDDLSYFAIHPGGKRILAEIEDALGIKKEDNQLAHQVLRNYGNMSSATVLFVLKEVLMKPVSDNEHVLSLAFGPGLTLESMLLRGVASSWNME